MSSVARSAASLVALVLLVGGCQLHKGKSKDGEGDGVAAAGPSGGVAKIVFAEEEFDLGTIDDREPVSHDFKFKNTGDGTLIIEKVGST